MMTWLLSWRFYGKSKDAYRVQNELGARFKCVCKRGKEGLNLLYLDRLLLSLIAWGLLGGVNRIRFLAASLTGGAIKLLKYDTDSGLAK